MVIHRRDSSPMKKPLRGASPFYFGNMMRGLLYMTTLLITCNIICGHISDKLQCKDENNLPVDWFVLYKLPKIQTSSNSLIRKGHAYLYITNATIESGWQLSTRSIGWNNSIAGITLAPLYNRKNEETNFWNLYNDSPPDALDISYHGHTKGVLIANSDQGFWMIHSVPNFPAVPDGGVQTRPLKKEDVTAIDGYSYPESGTFYGQSFLCISIGGDQFDIVGKQLMYNEIAVYAKNIPDIIGDRYPVLKNATNQGRIKRSPYNRKAVITSLGNVEFISFAKSGKWGKELYADFVAPQLSSDLYVQSWLNGRGKLPSTCSRRKIYNVKSLIIEAANADYTSTRDHSKWAITVSKKAHHHWVCVGDINRADTQFSRGGGAVCFAKVQLWNAYFDVINDIQRCSEA